MKNLRINRTVALLCAVGCVLASTANSAFADVGKAAPVPAYVLQAHLATIFSAAEGKARFVAYTDEGHCSFDTFITGVKPGTVMVIGVRRGRDRAAVGWLTADKSGKAVVELNTFRGDPIPMCQAGDVVEVFTVTSGAKDPKRIVAQPYKYNLFMAGVLE